MNKFSVLSKITVNLSCVVCLLEIKKNRCLRSKIILRSLKGSVYHITFIEPPSMKKGNGYGTLTRANFL